MIIRPKEIFYQRVTETDAEEIVNTTLMAGRPVERLLYQDVKTGRYLTHVHDIPFYKHQHRVILKNIGKIDPADIQDSIAAGAYQSLVRVLTTMTSEEVIEAVEASGLRGRGGGGFPTGRKWRFALNYARRHPGMVYLIGNGDEGDPGAFMDRTLMEGDPHAILEGMIIGAYAVGARLGYIYVRLEYPLAVHNLLTALDQARDLGLLGENILGTGFSFDIQINRGAGAFVCGEETALIASLEGRVGEPVTRPPYPAESGLWNRPTIINNVETWANVPHIIEKGADWYASLGVPHSTGTKIFSLVGKVNNVGLVEVPMGVTLGSVVEDIGGGVPGQERFKAVQTGGPSGGCIPFELKDVPPEEWKPADIGLRSRGFIPFELKDLPVDFDSLLKAGSMMGSGGMIVMDQRDCMVDVARYFLRFLKEESCGKCLPRPGLEVLTGSPKVQNVRRWVLEMLLADCPASPEIRELARQHGVTFSRFKTKDPQEACLRCGLCIAVCAEVVGTQALTFGSRGVNKQLDTPYRVPNNACVACGCCITVCPTSAMSLRIDQVRGDISRRTGHGYAH